MLVIRREILFLIKDHPECTFDFISRHFLAKNPQTIHYHLLKLQKEGQIKKLGMTRGVVYVAV
ncbi:MAG: hypothetical protein UX80_C0005G0015 [Candidatus Amesbacteria bacterium GW2011_GWA2_47_11b]|uniref:HTH arsR-type domain-containing protein n=2 Tax=Candidatus Amesiibacteriota TaxID=1752730 RepID=A0A0G1UKE8_9BACT|nr:MAG: hypothetical protein UX42_C0001G0073 [Microgenomates group bacterium GW2011_GWC1_46_20]KKU58195.1 MAG: hypothetical protein UX80_C0005G0015 [Candidatus Amesbacteria bacterium GW2011_GWA2_47_11b]KKU83368.1 MAG: hypothetical protein UY11_C0021G0008 [Candidatus Amesbacteria bacterium GW2011_GWC2_47_8]